MFDPQTIATAVTAARFSAMRWASLLAIAAIPWKILEQDLLGGRNGTTRSGLEGGNPSSWHAACSIVMGHGRLAAPEVRETEPTETALVMESGMRQEDAFRLRECRLYNPHHPPILPHLPVF